jgi:RNA polymerase sigma factor (sigma-70 family)
MREDVKDSLDDYLTQAKKCIIKYTNTINPEDDFISFVAHYMMLADWRFDPSKGNKIVTFRMAYAKGAIKMYFRKKRSFVDSMLSLQNQNDGHTQERSDFHIADYDMEPEHKEELDIIFEKMDALLPRERYILTEVLLNNKRYSVLSRELSISKQGIRNIYDKALHKTKMSVDAAFNK